MCTLGGKQTIRERKIYSQTLTRKLIDLNPI